ncbi:hypothetical protein EDB19DRAFT_1826263 [Suillus lakei]|nr:hypothetical protein EDB19DRAFT_1826263 [Suillus lakei]
MCESKDKQEEKRISKHVTNANEHEPSMTCVKLSINLQPTSPLADFHIWDILKTFLTSNTMSLGLVPAKWKKIIDALFSVVEDDEVVLQNFRLNPFLDLEAEEDEDKKDKDK